MLRDGAKLEIGRDGMGHVDVGVTHDVCGKGRYKEEARAVWLTPHFSLFAEKFFVRQRSQDFSRSEIRTLSGRVPVLMRD